MNLSADQLTAAIAEAVAVVRAGWAERPHAAIILGTGLGSLAQHITIEAEWSYHDLPHFVRSTADGHRGRLLAGRLAGVPLIAMDGRFHAYEGYSARQITFPVRVLAALGAEFLIVSNASGGMNPLLHSGDILLIDDHVNLMGNVGWALLPVPADETGVRGGVSPPVSHECTGGLTPPRSPRHLMDGRARNMFYDPKLLSLAERFSAEEHIPIRRGTYVAMLGPNYETRAEYRWLRTLGDVVGMSTVPEVLVAHELGLPVVAFSMVTNVFRADDAQQTTSAEVVNAAANAEPQLRRLVIRLLTSKLLELPAT